MIVTGRGAMLSPQEVLSDCIHALPAFGAFWEVEDTYRHKDGQYSVCGVYITLTWFLREHWQSLCESDWRALASLASDHRGRDEEPASNIGACLIEGLEDEAFSPLVALYFDKELLRAFGFMA